MEGGTSTGLYILVGIVIFGLFLLIVGLFFQEQLSSMIENSTGTVNKAVTSNLENANLTGLGSGSVSPG